MTSLVATVLVPAVALAIPPGLKKSERVTCDGSQKVVISKRYIDVKGDGVTVEGQCSVIITDSHIIAKGYAVTAAGEAEVTIRNSTLKGGKSALYLGDQAEVKAQGNKLSGGILVMGQADYDDQGGNQNQRSQEAVVASEPDGGVDEGPPEGETKTVLPEKLRKSKPVVCRKSVRAITLKKRVIESRRDGVVIYGNCTVTVEQSLIKSGGWAISHQGKGKLIIKDSILEGGKGALQVRFAPVIEIAGSTVSGKLDKPAELDITDQGGNTFQ